MHRTPWLGRAASGALIAAFLLTAAALASPSATTRLTKEGGTFRVAFLSGRLDNIDPALGGLPIAQRLLAPACSSLMAYPDKPLPAGLRVAPELAETEPVVSRDGKTYTFTIRKGVRFSDGSPVTARAFAHALERIFTPAMRSNPDLVERFEDIIGARKVLAGKETTLSGAFAKGRTLTLRLNKRVPDLPERLAPLCAVPTNLPVDPEGAKAPLPSPAPYSVAEYVPGARLVLERNPFYSGERPHHVARFVVDLASDFGPGIDQVASGAVDTFWPGPTPEQTPQLVRRYGVNKSQFFVSPGTALRVFSFNMTRPLFRDNPQLRQALNFAVDRRALVREAGAYAESPTDQYLLPGSPGYRDEHIYPLKGADLRTARRLAKGHTRSGKAVLYTIDQPSEVARAQIMQRNLKAIGIELEVKTFPIPLYFDKLGTPGEPYDLARIILTDLTNPLNRSFLFEDLMGSSLKWKRLLDGTARLKGDELYRAYGELDVELSRDFAPMIPVAVANQQTFVSARVGCIVLNPVLDLTAACLK